MNTTLPDLTSPTLATPLRHQSSCASLSLPLLKFLNDILPPPPSLTLSVGSGPGLLEALLLHHFPTRGALSIVEHPDTDSNAQDDDNPPQKLKTAFYGVEVRGVNRFLPETNVITVPGTWAIAAADADAAEGLLFVYPRQPGLVRSYLEGAGAGLRVVVWIGPRCDLEEFSRPLGDWGVEEVSVGGDGDGDGTAGEGGAVSGSGGLVEDGEVVVVYRRRV